MNFISLSNAVELFAAVLDISAFLILLVRLGGLLPRKQDDSSSDAGMVPLLGCGGCFFGFVATVVGAFVGIGGLIYHFRTEIQKLWQLLTAGG